MIGLFIWKATFRVVQPHGKGNVKLVDCVRADDLVSALNTAKRIAEKHGWILHAVEKVNAK